MEITEVFYPKVRDEWRRWLETHHLIKSEIWLRRFRKDAGEPTISFEDLIEECLCFGWIDSTIKKYDEHSSVQRITPRRNQSFLSELNRQRIWKLQKLGLMTPAGTALIEDQIGSPSDNWSIPSWIESQLGTDPEVWQNFQEFPILYRRLKIGWITEAGKTRQEEMQRRLNYLIKKTRENKMYGTIPILD